MKKAYSIGLSLFFVVIFGAFIGGRIPTAKAQANLTPEQRASLEAELRQVEADAAAAQNQLTSAQAQSASLSRDIAVLDAKIRAAQLDIKAKTILIQTLGVDIDNKQKRIDFLEARIDKGKDTLADLLRKTNEMDKHSLPEVLLSGSSVSGFFKDIDTFQSVQQGLADTFDMLKADQASTTEEKDALDKRRNATLDARHTIETQKANVTADQVEQKKLLTISKGNEKAYSAVITQKQARASQIKAALFALAGAQAIPFGDALNYANMVYQKTGVPPAFLLAIVKQETNLGKNVGTCYLTNTNDGSGLNSRTNMVTSKVMKPDRDVQPFIQITQELGLDYKSLLVSCPQSVGWGGGMGPAQFIASTWMLPSLRNRIISDLGNEHPNPWKPLDAFMAAGIYLSDLGAGSTSYSAQRNAACKYYSGRSCGYVTGNTSYGNSVMALADSIQQNMINPLAGL